MNKRPKPVVLTVLDGWGFNPESRGNAIALARKPNYDALLKKFPHALVHTSGPYVGLPEGQMGNSEVGHLNIGAGRVIHMDITRIDLAIASGELFRHPLLIEAIERGRERQLHLLGLVSDGGVHSHNEHLYALLRMARQHGVERLFVHAFMDGRDTPPDSGADFLRALEQKMREYGGGQIASVIGRYYAMDRDNRWERIERAYRAMVHGEAPHRSPDAAAAVVASYQRGVSDEFIEPAVITQGPGPDAPPRGCIRDRDAVIFFNFRADRARQTTRALAEPGFDRFADPRRPQDLCFAAMTQYEKTWPWLKFVFGPEKVSHILAQVFAEQDFRNLRCAETEKYAHVTYFFNGGIEKPFGGEERVLVPSPKVPTYDLKPEMSAAGIADAVVGAIEKGDFDAIVMNFANADMVGHSGKLEAAIKAVEAVDECLGRIYAALRARHEPAAWIITADHGNAEVMMDPATGAPHTYHTTNPVPFLLMTDDANVALRPGGALQDIAPTLLGILGLPQPAEMTGRDLRVKGK
jgi:2,3-bisphosphoglycerate-independent phosphoglycerate mutase